MAKKRLTCFLVALTILLLTISSLPLSGQLDPVEKEDRQFEKSLLEILSMSPDPHLDLAPNVVVNGTSGEFSSSFHSSINESDPSYIELNWTHVHDTPLQFRPDQNITECADFIYFTQSFDWPYEEMPLEVELRFNYSTVFTESFYDETYGYLMSDVIVWLIDSSGVWTRLYQTSPFSPSGFEERRSVLSPDEIIDAWEGMISNETHTPEDPYDSLTIAVGLSPNLRFLSYQSTEPWTFYNGSVYLRVSDIDIYVKMDVPPDPSTHIDPLFSSTWGMNISDIYPHSEGETEDHCYDVAAGEDGAVYVVGWTSTGYEYYSTTKNLFISEILLMYDSELNLLWKRETANKSRGYDVEVLRGNVYTAGDIRTERSETVRTNYDSYVTKWGRGGNRIWSAQWGDNLNQRAVSVAVDNDLSVYVLASDEYWKRYPDYLEYRSALLKYNSVGLLMWNKTLDLATYPSYGKIFFTDERLVLDYGGFFSVMDLDGNEQWNMTHYGVLTVDSGHIYVTRYGGQGVSFEKWSIDGGSIWNTSYSSRFVNGDYDNVLGLQMDLAPDGSIFTLTQEYFLQRFTLVKINSDGTLNWSKTIGSPEWPYYAVPAMTVSSWGIAYFTMTIEKDFHTYALPIDSYTLPKPGLSLPIWIVIGGGVVALVLLVWVYRKRSF